VPVFSTSVEIAISIPTPHLADARQRLWHLLVEHVLEDGRAETFSIQPELLRPDTPPNVARDREALLGHLELRRADAMSSLLRPTRWPIEPLTVEWLKRVGPWVNRLIFWRGNQWILQSSMWGRSFELLAQPGEWAGLGPALESELAAPLNETETPLRKQGHIERRGWAVSRIARRAVALAAGLAAGLFAALTGSELVECLAPAVGIGFLVFTAVPQREPGPFHRLFGRANFPTDPGFDRRVHWLMGLAVVGTLVWAFAGAAGALSEPGSTWRTGWWILAALGFVATVFSGGVSLRWLLKHQVG
jgi:hypothetical protein